MIGSAPKLRPNNTCLKKALVRENEQFTVSWFKFKYKLTTVDPSPGSRASSDQHSFTVATVRLSVCENKALSVKEGNLFPHIKILIGSKMKN